MTLGNMRENGVRSLAVSCSVAECRSVEAELFGTVVAIVGTKPPKDKPK